MQRSVKNGALHFNWASCWQIIWMIKILQTFWKWKEKNFYCAKHSSKLDIGAIPFSASENSAAAGVCTSPGEGRIVLWTGKCANRNPTDAIIKIVLRSFCFIHEILLWFLWINWCIKVCMLILPYAEEIQNMSNCFGKNKVIRHIDFIRKWTYNRNKYIN